MQVPDSPRTREMWQAVTSPAGFDNLADSTRAHFVNLAQSIIDALPSRIKNEPTGRTLVHTGFVKSKRSNV